MSKRKRPEPKSSSSMGGINEDEKKLLTLIRSKEGMGATTFEMKVGTSIQPTLITRAIASLKRNHLIKEVPNMNNKGIKHFLGVEFEPCKELTGGDWYIDGALDVDKIEGLKEICVKILERHKNRVVTLDVICSYFEKVMDKDKLTKEQTKEILKNLVLDNVIMEVKSSGLSEFSSTRIGEVCYKLTGKKSGGGEARAGAFASVPCGVCPHVALCSPGGVISPTTCVYFQKWLDF
ncbi:hypothetical protein EUTSA_v10005351mg [Eutrema salsugineum]|uniref:DNA-directed RNA polymerase III subunit RPC6 n=1 Tax=Eutrema salsugineum TaxID=72664 RepID=V4KX09_EUTSA|nr:DNA-directed RNA polymerase III subunit rpc6 [Eutrema salsugineum]XP_024006750.1 DNA-directed RNA polymerase III subunit rpc6 [Eutrema salsugineum]XP_024006751.1 DNA-directed RNA polymerase III subunit rpc6 [Eutrema salsugineum]ESQ31918.1 hypothetical protein EUTSA_v10005351mg [Eutrema salsugineum]